MKKEVSLVPSGWRFSVAVFALGSLLIGTSGCGGGGPDRYHLSGSVTYGGQPILAGSVTLIPDSALGNSGPAISVPIQNGKFDTRGSGSGHVGGPHIVKITALDGKGGDEFFPQGMPMFPDYEMPLDLPKQDGTQNLEVPADWKPPSEPQGQAPTA